MPALAHDYDMWIKDVDVPRELVAAARDGRLVVFVGAGASRDAPSGLPDFKQLVTHIGDQVADPPTEADFERPDVYLGRLEDKGVDVKGLLASAIGVPGSCPNDLHQALVRLAATCGAPRIVTTNYDSHLEDAATELGMEFRQYCAPALPLGDDFDGIVHLHGSLRGPHNGLVASDTDFGRAYLRDAWAARFLERMFGKYVVLFVGYSHGDVVMQYLARSLAATGRRYVLTATPDASEWRSLGLVPVAYPASGSDHSALLAFVSRWAETAAMQQVHHRQTIHRLVEHGVPMVPEEISYLEETLQNSEQLQYFVERATGIEWLEWALSQPAFRGYVSGAGDHRSQHLAARWITDRFMFDAENSRLALSLLANVRWSEQLSSEVVEAIASCDRAIVGDVAAWLTLAIQMNPNSTSDVSDMLLSEGKWGSDISVALYVFEDRTSPFLAPSRISFGWRTPSLEVVLPGHEHWLTEAWVKVFVPALDNDLEAVLRVVDQQLARMYRVYRVLDNGFDMLNHRRSAIERHEQDAYRETADVLVDAARDCIEHALATESDLAESYVRKWGSRDAALFRRLAVHAYRIREDVSADMKLAWLEDGDWLWERALHHEVFLLVAEALPVASQASVDRVVAEVARGPEDAIDDEHRQRCAYDFLGWLDKRAPGTPSIESALRHIQLAHPSWKTTDHPEFTHFMTSGSVDYQGPFSVEEPAELVADSPVEATRRLKQLSPRQEGPGNTSSAGIRNLVREYVAADPEGGLALAAALEEGDGELMCAVVDGWSSAHLDEETAGRVVSSVDAWPVGPIRAQAAQMLAAPAGGSLRWSAVPGATELALKLWPAEETEGGVRDDHDLLTEAANHPAGNLAEFWCQVVRDRWEDAGDSWAGIPEGLGVVLSDMLGAEGRRGLLAQTVIGGRLGFFYAADPDWTSELLLPLFDGAGGEGSLNGPWQGFLRIGRPDDGLLEAGLLGDYLWLSSRAGDMPEELQRRLCVHLVEVALFGSPEPLYWLRKFIGDSSEEIRCIWTRELDRRLEGMGPQETASQWDRWLADYWKLRSESLPLPLSPVEASELAHLLVNLNPLVDQAEPGLLKMPASLLPQRGLLPRISRLDLSAEPRAWACIVTHLLSNTEGTAWEAKLPLNRIVEKLREADPTIDLSGLVEAAMRLGATDAADWGGDGRVCALTPGLLK